VVRDETKETSGRWEGGRDMGAWAEGGEDREGCRAIEESGSVERGGEIQSIPGCLLLRK